MGSEMCIRDRLKRVIVSYENSIAMEPTLDEALRKVFGRSSRMTVVKADSDAEPGAVDTVVVSPTWQSLALEAGLLLEEAVSAQKDGNWSDYGAKLEELELTLKDLTTSAAAE